MANGFTQLLPDSTGKRIDTEELTVATLAVHRQRIVLASATDVAAFASPTAKGTQAPYALPTQDLHNSGRTRVAIVFMGTAPATADTLLSLVKTSNGVAAAGAVSIGVASGKTLRITSAIFSLKSNATTAAFGTATFRTNPTGATVLASPAEYRLDVGTTAAVAGGAGYQDVQIPDGLEYSGTQTIGVSLSSHATTNIISISLLGFEY